MSFRSSGGERMKIMPIPDELLGDSITLLEPTISGYRETEIIHAQCIISQFPLD